MKFSIVTKKLMFDRRDMEVWFLSDKDPIHLFDYSVATGSGAFFDNGRGYEIERCVKHLNDALNPGERECEGCGKILTDERLWMGKIPRCKECEKKWNEDDTDWY